MSLEIDLPAARRLIGQMLEESTAQAGVHRAEEPQLDAGALGFGFTAEATALAESYRILHRRVGKAWESARNAAEKAESGVNRVEVADQANAAQLLGRNR